MYIFNEEFQQNMQIRQAKCGSKMSPFFCHLQMQILLTAAKILFLVESLLCSPANMLTGYVTP